MNKLNAKQVHLIELYKQGKFNQFTATREEQDLFSDIIDKAEQLRNEMDAWDEIEEKFDDDLIVWFSSKI